MVGAWRLSLARSKHGPSSKSGTGSNTHSPAAMPLDPDLALLQHREHEHSLLSPLPPPLPPLPLPLSDRDYGQDTVSNSALVTTTPPDKSPSRPNPPLTTAASAPQQPPTLPLLRSHHPPFSALTSNHTDTTATTVADTTTDAVHDDDVFGTSRHNEYGNHPTVRSASRPHPAVTPHPATSSSAPPPRPTTACPRTQPPCGVLPHGLPPPPTAPTLSLPPLNFLGDLRRVNSDTFLLRPHKTLTPLPPHARPPFIPMPTRTRLPSNCDVTASLSFAQRTVAAVNDAAVCLLVSIGHQLGLFTVLARLAPTPHPAHIIASAAALRTRPVAEWLAAMACASIVDIHMHHPRNSSDDLDDEYLDDNDVNDDDLDDRGNECAGFGVGLSGGESGACDPFGVSRRVSYVLPAEHAPWLTWDSGTNLALLCQSVPALARVEHSVVHCYRRGVGLDRGAYAAYERIMAYDVMQTVGTRVLSILRLAPHLLDKLSLGICVLCVGGAADAVYVRLARIFPRSWFTCYGTSERHAAAARKTVEDGGVTNVHFQTVRKLDDMRERDSFDVALVLEGTAIRECDEPVVGLRAVRDALRPGSCLVYVELMGGGDIEADRKNRVGLYLYSVAGLYSVPKAMASGNVGEAVSGIWGHVRVRKAMYEAMFSDVRAHALEDDSLNCVLIASITKDHPN